MKACTLRPNLLRKTLPWSSGCNVDPVLEQHWAGVGGQLGMAWCWSSPGLFIAHRGYANCLARFLIIGASSKNSFLAIIPLDTRTQQKKPSILILSTWQFRFKATSENLHNQGSNYTCILGPIIVMMIMPGPLLNLNGTPSSAKQCHG